MSEHFLQNGISRRRYLSALCAGLALALCVGLTVSADDDTHPRGNSQGPGSGPWQRWKSIHLKVNAMPLLSGRVWMHQTLDAKQLTFKTEATAKFLGAKVSTAYTTSWIDRASGRPTGYLSYNNKRARRYTFNATGYLVEKLVPESKKTPMSEWTVTKRESFAYPLDSEGKTIPVYDYYSMLLQLRRVRLSSVGDEVTLYVASSSGATPYIVRVVELQADEMSYRTLPDGKKTSAIVKKMRLQVLPADPERAGEGFLNMKGETELWVEADSKTVLRIGGKAPKVPGRIILVLEEMG